MHAAPELIARTLEDFLAGRRDAVVIEDGALLFDLATANYSISAQHGKCVLHLWSPERNTVRRIVDCEVKNDTLRLSVLRFGQSKPVKLEICREHDRRSPGQRRTARARYESLLQRMLTREFPGWTVARPTSSVDLSRSFGPVYARASMRQGPAEFAVLGVNAQETQASIDASLTFALLWLDALRQSARRHLAGLRLFVPAQTSAVVRARIACLNRGAAHLQLYEVEERGESCSEIDCSDRGNIATRLLHSADQRAARERFAKSIAVISGLLPQVEVALLSPAEIAFRLHGLEFARARLAPDANSFRNAEQVVFGMGAQETVLSEDNAEQFAGRVQQLAAARHAAGSRDHPLWRACPERWLESLVVRDLGALDDRLDPAAVYSQVPAFAASDRAMIDVLAATRDGRLAVVELKADEDIHLPLQGLDYWARVCWHHARGEFQRFGYFPARQLSSAPPLLLLVSPALRVHPATDALLRYISPEIECELIAIDERWRDGLRVIFRKRREKTFSADSRG